mgnify:CR=1 FL=1
MAHSKSEIRKAKNLLSKYAPKGEQLAFINAKEVNLLKRKGGSGKMTIAGIKSYGPNDDDYSDNMQSGDYGGSDSTNNSSNNDYMNYYTPSKPSILSRIGDFIKGGGFTGMAIRAVGKGLKANKEQNRRDKLTSQFKSEEGPMGLRNNNMGGGNNNNSATNVGGKIIKLAPTSAEISQSSATDAAAYDNRKTKAKGRSMTIMTSSRGINRNNTLTLGKPSLLGA